MSVGGADAAAESGRRSLERTGKAYDLLADRYQTLMWENPVLAHSARVSEELVTRVTAPHTRLLEVGCGTGRETLKMAKLGKRVVACDVSKASLEVLARSAAELGLEDRIETRHVPASGLAAIEEEFGAHSFEAAYSSFALHYEPDLRPIPPLVWKLLKPDAPFLCSIFNRACLMEWVLLAPFLVPRRGLRRLEGYMQLPVDEFEATVRSWLPSEVKRIFRPQFAFEENWALPAIIPPHYLHILVTRSGIVRPAWEAADRRLNASWPLRNLGSHTAFLFRTRGAPEGG